MKIPIKYGLLITLGMMAWVLITRSLITNPQSIVHTLGGPIFFNVLQFAMIYLGLKALEQSLDPQTEQLEKVSLKPTKANIAVKVLTLAWAPYWDDKPAWE